MRSASWNRLLAATPVLLSAACGSDLPAYEAPCDAPLVGPPSTARLALHMGELVSIAPQLQLLLLSEDASIRCDPEPDGCELAQLERCVVEVDEVALGETRDVLFALNDPAPVDLWLDDVAWAEGSCSAFSLVAPLPETVTARTATAFEIRFAPTTEEPCDARLVIHSDAWSAEEGDTAVLTLRGRGVTSRE